MNIISELLKRFLNFQFYFRRAIPKRINKKIGGRIKKSKCLMTIFSLPYGIIFRSYNKDYSRIILLKHKNFPSTINIVDLSSVEGYREIMIENAYEKYNSLKKNDVVLDVGANIGIFSVKAAMKVGEKGKIIAIEAEPKNIKLLKENTRDFNNVIVIPKAAGNSTGQIELVVGIHSGAHYINPTIKEDGKKETILIPIDKIDNYIEDLDLEIIDFVKMDIEGWEYQALKGAENSIGKFKYLIIASYHTKDEKIIITRFLKSHNFKVINDGEFTHAWNKNFN